MKKHIYFLLFFVFSLVQVKSQYYYKDILVNKQLLTEIATLKAEKVRAVNVTSLEYDGLPSEGFFCQKKISKDYSEIEIVTKTSSSYKTILTSVFSRDGLLISTNDSSEISVTNTYYSYNENNNPTKILSETHFAADDYNDENFEEHHYFYDASNSLPVKLLLVKNKKDSTVILFSADESKNVAIEKNTATGESYYYYYDTKSRLTDIAHKYQNQKKLTTDYIFQYNQANQITQMTVGEEEGAYFFVWKYTYEENLRINERCFSKERKLLGTIEYAYK